MKKIVSLVMASALWLMGCSTSGNTLSPACKVHVYENRHSSQRYPQNDEELEALIRELVGGTDDAYKQIVTSGDIKELKQQQCVEIIFPNPLTIPVNDAKSITMSKILIPLHRGDGDEVVFYCGRKTYFSPPYVNSKGARILERIMQCVTTIP